MARCISKLLDMRLCKVTSTGRARDLLLRGSCHNSFDQRVALQLAVEERLAFYPSAGTQAYRLTTFKTGAHRSEPFKKVYGPILWAHRSSLGH